MTSKDCPPYYRFVDPWAAWLCSARLFFAASVCLLFMPLTFGNHKHGQEAKAGNVRPLGDSRDICIRP